MTEYRYKVQGESPAGEFTLSFLSRRPITGPACLSGPTGDDLAYLRGRVREETPGPAHITAVAVTAA
ncbi:hypothetical protein [Melissospora conviva]|uniref:hypothetical protein n=1 Tax=Melissospora conviva TaxID=3388432 RepID=UPI003C151DB1